MRVEDVLNSISELMGSDLNFDEKIEIINKVKIKLSEYSPFKNNPVDCVIWVRAEDVEANDYNPNSVAPPEMKLLEHSILEDGYTQPIVTWENPEKPGQYEVIDGFHRNRVGKESVEVRGRTMGRLPVVIIRDSQTGKNDRIASTIRHNRARGKHKIESMSDIVIELTRRNWSEDKIAKNLGMDEDEVLRLKQITGLAEMFSDKDFSKAWDIESFDEAGELDESDMD